MALCKNVGTVDRAIRGLVGVVANHARVHDAERDGGCDRRDRGGGCRRDHAADGGDRDVPVVSADWPEHVQDEVVQWILGGANG